MSKSIDTATNTRLRVAIIVGSVRAGRFGPFVGAWVGKSLVGLDLDVTLIDLADMTLPADLTPGPDTAALADQIDRADAIMVVTPEYNHSYPGPLKTAIDSVRDQWHGKPVAFVSYGGTAGGLRAVEALRLVFAELHAVTVRDTVSLHNPWGPAADPTIDYPGDAAVQALRQQVRQLRWWAEALRTARRHSPYPV